MLQLRWLLSVTPGGLWVIPAWDSFIYSHLDCASVIAITDLCFQKMAEKVAESHTLPVPCPHTRSFSTSLKAWQSCNLYFIFVGIILDFPTGSISTQMGGPTYDSIENMKSLWQNPYFDLISFFTHTGFISSYSSFRCCLSVDPSPVLHWVWPDQVISPFDVIFPSITHAWMIL